MHARTTRALTALVAVALLSTSIAADAASESAAPKAKAPHTTSVRKVALGVSMYPDYGDQPTYANFVSDTGHAPALWTVWADWADGNSAFPTDLVNRLHTAGSTPLIIWQPVGTNSAPAGDKQPLESYCGTSYDNIINGSWDPYIKSWADAAKLTTGPILIRFAHEMDGGWFPFGYTRCTNTAKKFKKMWKHVVGIFRTEHAINVKFVWSPLNAGLKTKKLYPGNSWVDYVGFSAFNWGSYKNLRWIDLATLAAHLTNGLKSYAGTKPWIVAETGSVQEGGHTRASWLTSGYKALYRNIPNITAVVYFDVDMTHLEHRQPDWRLTGKALEAYKNLLALKKFQGKIN